VYTRRRYRAGGAIASAETDVCGASSGRRSGEAGAENDGEKEEGDVKEEVEVEEEEEEEEVDELAGSHRPWVGGVKVSLNQASSDSGSEPVVGSAPSICSTRMCTLKPNVEPLFSWLCTHIEPPIIPHSRLDMASPKPVPSYLLYTT
jgi:hypothetical protein